MKQHPDYGVYRLYLAFKLHGIKISQSKIRRICRINGIVAKARKSKPPARDRNLPVSNTPNLIKDLLVDRPDYVWSGDFSYFKVKGIWHYLATCIDNYTKEIVGFSLSQHHDTTLITRALHMALSHNRKPNIFHSDQGSEYTSLEFQNLLSKNNIRVSNSAKSSPWENGCQESFYGKFKDELKLYRLDYCNSYMEIYNLLAGQIHYYNNNRIHTTIKNIPVAFYRTFKHLQLNNLELGLSSSLEENKLL